MITRDLAKKQIRRLSGQPFFKADEFAMRELVDTLVAVAEDDGHAQSIVSECLGLVDEDERPVCAAPQDIKRIAFQTRRTELRPQAECPRCSGSGWRVRERNGFSGAERCDCWKRAPLSDAPDYRSVSAEPELARQVASGKGMQ